jgi:hypothetical protein
MAVRHRSCGRSDIYGHRHLPRACSAGCRLTWSLCCIKPGIIDALGKPPGALGYHSTLTSWRVELWSQLTSAVVLVGLGLLELLYQRPSNLLLLVMAAATLVATVIVLRRRRTIAPTPPSSGYSLENPIRTGVRAAAGSWRVGLFVVIGVFTTYGGAATLAIGFALLILSLASLLRLARFERRENVRVLRGGSLDWVRPSRQRRPAYVLARESRR